MVETTKQDVFLVMFGDTILIIGEFWWLW